MYGKNGPEVAHKADFPCPRSEKVLVQSKEVSVIPAPVCHSRVGGNPVWIPDLGRG